MDLNTKYWEHYVTVTFHNEGIVRVRQERT